MYSAGGKLISVREALKSGVAAAQSGKRTHIANFTFACVGNGADTLMRADFPYGYFDGRGVHWMMPDAIGSVELVIDGDGLVEQHTGYYPYGEPWRVPAGQPYLYGGKERRRFAGLGDSDFHARFLTTATALWQAPDVHAGKYPWLSPWAFCAANPIKYMDPFGKDIYLIGFAGNLTGIEIDDKYDRLVILNINNEDVESTCYPKGTIISCRRESIKPQIDGLVLEVVGDDNGSEIFEFLESNTVVEYCQFKCDTDDQREKNYIGTSHTGDNEKMGVWLIENEFKNSDIKVREYIHSHPSGLLWPSGMDKSIGEWTKTVLKQDVTCKVYTRVAYEGLGHYVSFTSETPDLTPMEFLQKYKAIK